MIPMSYIMSSFAYVIGTYFCDCMRQIMADCYAMCFVCHQTQGIVCMTYVDCLSIKMHITSIGIIMIKISLMTTLSLQWESGNLDWLCLHWNRVLDMKIVGYFIILGQFHKQMVEYKLRFVHLLLLSFLLSFFRSKQHAVLHMIMPKVQCPHEYVCDHTIMHVTLTSKLTNWQLYPIAGLLLITWSNLNPGMDKYWNPLWSVTWNWITYPFQTVRVQLLKVGSG